MASKTMDADTRDKVCNVMHKLSVLGDLFAFYWIAHDKVVFQKDSITGLSVIVSDCINELQEIAKNIPLTKPPPWTHNTNTKLTVVPTPS